MKQGGGNCESCPPLPLTTSNNNNSSSSNNNNSSNSNSNTSSNKTRVQQQDLLQHKMSGRVSSVRWWCPCFLLVVLVVGGIPSLAMPQGIVGDGEQQGGSSLAAQAAAAAAQAASETEDRSSNPVFNVLEYVRISDPSTLLQPSPEAALAPALDAPASPSGVLSDSPSSQGAERSPCMWAIVNCCQGTENSIGIMREKCFNSHLCGGAWFEDLCSQEFRDIAHSIVLNIFSSPLN